MEKLDLIEYIDGLQDDQSLMQQHEEEIFVSRLATDIAAYADLATLNKLLKPYNLQIKKVGAK